MQRWRIRLNVFHFLLTAWYQPKFLSKEERAKIAIAKRAAEIKEERVREQRRREERERLEKEAERLRVPESANNIGQAQRRG